MGEQRFLIKSCAHIMRKTQSHLDCALKKYGLTSGSYPYLLALSDEEGINLDTVSRRVGVDKAMSTRTIQKLMERGYLEKVPDASDSRAFQLYLTDRARECIPKIRREIMRCIGILTAGMTGEEKDAAARLLGRMEKNAGNLECKGKGSFK
ncbi:MAG TPA: MarR family transcriptional regulator [Ruminococcaceae bacterium]|jgi:DNA-binding MarR family transcriptional regulator|nr:MarR family transcriptional regulator [Oscillospiraceae bacterium]